MPAATRHFANPSSYFFSQSLILHHNSSHGEHEQTSSRACGGGKKRHISCLTNANCRDQLTLRSTRLSSSTEEQEQPSFCSTISHSLSASKNASTESTLSIRFRRALLPRFPPLRTRDEPFSLLRAHAIELVYAYKRVRTHSLTHQLRMRQR